MWHPYTLDGHGPVRLVPLMPTDSCCARRLYMPAANGLQAPSGNSHLGGRRHNGPSSEE